VGATDEKCLRQHRALITSALPIVGVARDRADTGRTRHSPSIDASRGRRSCSFHTHPDLQAMNRADQFSGGACWPRPLPRSQQSGFLMSAFIAVNKYSLHAMYRTADCGVPGASRARVSASRIHLPASMQRQYPDVFSLSKKPASPAQADAVCKHNAQPGRTDFESARDGRAQGGEFHRHAAS